MESFLDISTKRHVVRLEPIVNTPLIHHMLVFHCAAEANVEFPLYEGVNLEKPPELEVCQNTIAIYVSSIRYSI
jgi:Copper type II ascorbate-dependent monooxygenase, N-terminal domain